MEMGIRQPVTISLIAPVYRVEKYIGRFADSVFSQSYPHIQFVFVNDGTDDSSMEILDSMIRNGYSHLKERIIIVNQPNCGLPAARKKGMEYATGDYVWHIDSDDWLEEDAVRKIAESASRTDADIIYFDFCREYVGKTKIAKEKDYDVSMKSLYQRNMCNHKAYGSVWNKCVKRRLYLDNVVHFPPYNHAEDIFLMSQLVGYAKSLVHLKEALYHYRSDNPDALTKQYSEKKRMELILNYMSLYEAFCETPDSPVSPVQNDIFYRAGKYALIYRLGLFGRYPYLADRISEAPLDCKGGESVFVQLLLKLYAWLRRKNKKD